MYWPLQLRAIQASEVIQRESSDPFPALVTLGFDPELIAPLRHKLPALCRVLFAPFGSDVAFEPAHWRRSERINGILGDDRWNFRLSAPADLMLLVRSFQGLLHHLAELDRPVLWTRPLEAVLARHASAIYNLPHNKNYIRSTTPSSKTILSLYKFAVYSFFHSA